MTDGTKSLVQQDLDKALISQRPMARQHVERLRRIHPDDTPADLIRRLDRYYLIRIAVSGAASGAKEVASDARIPAALADTVSSTETSAFYLLSLAEVHGLHPDDFERRKLLLLTVLFNEEAATTRDKAVGRTAPLWGRHIVEAIPMSPINKINKKLGHRFITKYGTRQGIIALGKQVPLGLGAALGAGSSYAFGRLTIESARAIFGEPPATWSTSDHADEAPFDSSSGDATP